MVAEFHSTRFISALNRLECGIGCDEGWCGCGGGLQVKPVRPSVELESCYQVDRDFSFISAKKTIHKL